MRSIVLFLALLGLVAGCAPASDGVAGSPAPKLSSGYGDKRLYRDIAARVAAGESYYEAAPALQRAHRYPTRPALTVRPPTLVWAAAAIGWERLRLAAGALVALAALTWFVALRGRVSTVERAAAALLCLGGGWALLGGNPVVLHERWAGMFITLALALRLSGRTGWSLVAACAALALRELALPFVLLALAFALYGRHWREAVGWAAVVAGYALLLAWHWHVVNLHTLPGDAVSQGWGGGFDPRGMVRAIVYTSPLQWTAAGPAIALTLLAPLGWLALGWRGGLFCLGLYPGMALMIALFARPDNFYWGAVVQPGWFIGLALVPRALLAASRWTRRRARPSPLARSDPAL